MKTCTGCGKEKRDELFPYQNKTKGLRRKICAECHRARNRTKGAPIQDSEGIPCAGMVEEHHLWLG